MSIIKEVEEIDKRLRATISGDKHADPTGSVYGWYVVLITKADTTN